MRDYACSAPHDHELYRLIGSGVCDKFPQLQTDSTSEGKRDSISEAEPTRNYPRYQRKELVGAVPKGIQICKR
jgi:hypothetical protein